MQNQNKFVIIVWQSEISHIWHLLTGLKEHSYICNTDSETLVTGQISTFDFNKGLSINIAATVL